MKALIRINDNLLDVKIGDFVQFIFNFNEFNLIRPLGDLGSDYEWMEEFWLKYPLRDKYQLRRYHNMLIIGKLDSFSRIYKTPILEVDFDLSIIRNNRINYILSK